MSGFPPEARLWSLMRGAMATQALRVAAQLRIADTLADGPRGIAALSSETDPDAVHRALRALASDGIFREVEPGVFANTPASELLRTDGDQAWHEFALQFGGEWYDAFARFPDAVETGEPTFPGLYGAHFETWMREHPDALEVFNRSMEMGAAQRIDAVASLDWDAEVVVDVGGGTGHMLAELIRRNPGLRGVLFDLPEVVAGVDPPAGVDVVAGNFLDGVPAADAYVLSRILHGLGDEKAARVLENIRAAADPGARVLLIESLVPPGNEPNGSKWLDLLMLVLSGGRERTEEEWRALLARAGLAIESIEDGLVRARCP
jgi:O-methyltransferase domain